MSAYYKDTERDNDRAHTERYHQKRASGYGNGFDDSSPSSDYPIRYGEENSGNRRGGGSNPCVHEAYRRDREYEEVRKREVDEEYENKGVEPYYKGGVGDSEYGDATEEGKNAGSDAGYLNDQRNEGHRSTYNHDDSDRTRKELYNARFGDGDRASSAENDKYTQRSENEYPRNEFDSEKGYPAEHPYLVNEHRPPPSHPIQGEDINWKGVATSVTSAAISQFGKAYEKSSEANAEEGAENENGHSSYGGRKEPSAFARRLEGEEGRGIREIKEEGGQLVEKVVEGAAGLFRKTFEKK